MSATTVEGNRFNTKQNKQERNEKKEWEYGDMECCIARVPLEW